MIYPDDFESKIDSFHSFRDKEFQTSWGGFWLKILDSPNLIGISIDGSNPYILDKRSNEIKEIVNEDVGKYTILSVDEDQNTAIVIHTKKVNDENNFFELTMNLTNFSIISTEKRDFYPFAYIPTKNFSIHYYLETSTDLNFPSESIIISLFTIMIFISRKRKILKRN